MGRESLTDVWRNPPVQYFCCDGNVEDVQPGLPYVAHIITSGDENKYKRMVRHIEAVIKDRSLPDVYEFDATQGQSPKEFLRTHRQTNLPLYWVNVRERKHQRDGILNLCSASSSSSSERMSVSDITPKNVPKR
jgi:hypothetical protein